MRGAYHERLRTLLTAAVKSGVCKQETLARAIGKTQTGVSKYLLDKGGALDLDEADAALRHVGSSLQAFLLDQPPRTLTDTEQLAHALSERPPLRQLVTDLLDVPLTRLKAVADLARMGLAAATAPPDAKTRESRAARSPARRRTTAAPKRRR